MASLSGWKSLLDNTLLNVSSACLFRLNSVILILLLRSNIERNPGPVKFISVNCRGLSSKVKLLSTIGKLRKECLKNDEAIIFLQETHLDDVELISNSWEGTVVIRSFFSSSQRGTIIILKGNFKVVALEIDPDGRYCMINATNNQIPEFNSLTLVNIYAPNNHRDSMIFFSRMFEALARFNESYQDPEIIIAGDFNFVFDEEVDCQNRNVTNDEKRLAEQVSRKLYDMELWDMVQASQDPCNYTWRRESIRSRIDYVFASNLIASKVSKLHNKWQLIKTDHAAIIMDLEQAKTSRSGRSYPKLSFNDIKEVEDRNFISGIIKEALENCLDEWNPHDRLEYVKLMIRSGVLSIRARRNVEISELDQLKAELNSIEQSPLLTEQDLMSASELNLKIGKTEEYVEEQLRIKSGIKWREEGERSTKYFLNLANSKARSNIMQGGFIDASGTLLTDSKDITNHAKCFYSELYSEKPVVIGNNFFNNCPNLDADESDTIGYPITVAELRNTLKSCKDLTPGLDGIPYSFYKVYADFLLPLVIDSWNYGLETGTLAPSHRQSCITVIPKAGKDPRLIKNWRPITVASCDLKIITKALSLRVAKVLPSVIYNSQMAYVPGRDINFNNRLLSFALEQGQNDNNMIISFDAEKAFDSVSHEYLRKTLEKYKFPNLFIRYFNLIYNDNSSVVQVNGHLSNPFPLGRGVKQGDALSCSLFILAVDPMIRNIEANNKIDSIYIKHSQVRLKTLAYADDIAVLTKDNGSIQEVFGEYERLFNCSGLRLNADKTEILRLSSNQGSNIEVQYLDKNISLEPAETIKICGNHLHLDQNIRYNLNITSKIKSL